MAIRIASLRIHDAGIERNMRGAWYAVLPNFASPTNSTLGSELAQSPPTADNCVVYIINPFKHAAALADICSAFWHLFQQLVADSERRQARPVNELVLQIIPLEFVMSSETMVVPPQSDYLNLALEVYSRCRPMDVDMSTLLCAPPILLADPLPRAIGFRLSPERASPLQDGRVLHIACSRSLDQRWITVAWSDVPGSIQRTMSYCLRYRQSGTSRPVSEVRQEIWTTTKHIMDKLPARWKIQLVTTEPMEPDEVEGKVFPFNSMVNH
jgi:mediator of RNA polymerase II transcription subunit 13